MKNNDLVIYFGRTAEGKEIFADFYDLPQLLIGGCTGSGKSNFIHYLIKTLMQRFSSKEIEFVLADPKQVELLEYNNLPYLKMPLVLTTNQALTALNWLVAEMERRYEILDDAKKMNIRLYNKKIKVKMPYIFFIADEISDFMASKERGERKSIEGSFVRIAQLGRAAGIYMVLASSRLSAAVFPGLLLGSITSRLVFKTATKNDSRWLLDGRPDAEQLLGRGDALFLTHKFRDPIRLQTPLNKTNG